MYADELGRDPNREREWSWAIIGRYMRLLECVALWEEEKISREEGTRVRNPCERLSPGDHAASMRMPLEVLGHLLSNLPSDGAFSQIAGSQPVRICVVVKINPHDHTPVSNLLVFLCVVSSRRLGPTAADLPLATAVLIARPVSGQPQKAWR